MSLRRRIFRYDQIDHFLHSESFRASALLTTTNVLRPRPVFCLPQYTPYLWHLHLARLARFSTFQYDSDASSRGDVKSGLSCCEQGVISVRLERCESPTAACLFRWCWMCTRPGALMCVFASKFSFTAWGDYLARRSANYQGDVTRPQCSRNGIYDCQPHPDLTTAANRARWSRNRDGGFTVGTTMAGNFFSV